MNYTELHLHSYYSLLDGLNSPKEYLVRAKELGMSHLALTDHGVLSGHREFQKHAMEAGITPILGCEMYISPTDRFDRRAVKKRDDNTQAYNHLIVLAQNQAGYENLNTLSERAWTEGFYSKPRIDMEILEEHQEGLIVLSGCRGGLIAKALENEMPALADSYTREFQGIFGDRFFMEIQAHNPREMNEGLFGLAEKYGILPVMTSDCHFAREEDLWVEQAMLIISSKPEHAKDFDFKKSQKMDMLERFNYAYPDRSMNFEDFDLWLHNAEEHLNSRHWPMSGSGTIPWDHSRVEKAISNTMVVADMIEPYEYYEGLELLPKPKGVKSSDKFLGMVERGARRRGTWGKPEYDERRDFETEIIIAKGFDPYFIVLGDTIEWGTEQGIRFGPGRGSGAGSLVMYELGGTEVDPIEHGLLFFRFINPERNDFPDADTDVEVNRRSEVKAYLAHKYGNVASIATFGTFQGKNSIRDAARAFMVPLGDVNRALKGMDWPSNMDWFEQWEPTDKGKEFKRKYPEVVKLAKLLHEPITKYAPMQTAKDNSDEAGTRIPLIALDMEQAAEVGFIKYDFLGLKALSIITDTVNSIKERHGVELDMPKIGLDDPKVYRELSEGWTKGVFQCEAVPYTNLIIKMGGLRGFDDLVASNALVRPGAANSTAGARYIARNKGEEMVQYHHEVMHPFTKETYGVVIYQEQVMQTMTELAGMSMSTADKVRKIIGKKRDVSEFEQYKQEFIDGASKHIPVKLAESLWHDFEAHAGYSFNKSHAVAYSMLSYWTAWLKLNYPLEFMWAVLKNEKDKDALLDYLIEAKRMGIRIKLPHVNNSDIDFSIEKDAKGEAIRFGLSNIKYISGKIGSRILDYRPFRDYNHLYEVTFTKGSGLTSRTLSSLNAIGGASFPDNPLTGQERDNFFEYLNIPAFETREIPPKVRAQFKQLDEFSQEGAFVSLGMVRGSKSGPGWARIEIVDESGSAGVFTNEHHTIESGQMYIFLIADNRISRYIKVGDFDINSDDPLTRYLATDRIKVPEDKLAVVSFTSRVTKAGKKMATAVFSDANKNLTSALVFPQSFMRCFALLREGRVVNVEFKETQEGTLFVDKVTP
jgi:DNA polymerase-3 subunit alpha